MLDLSTEEHPMTTATGTKVVPLISSGTAGPLGAVHLPRLWTKLTLSSAGVLADGYDFCGQGFDQMTIDALGLNRERTIEYVRTKKPTYLQFEQWVVDQNGGSLGKEKIDAHNKAIFGYKHAPDLAGQMRTASGLKNASTSDAVTLNMLEDLDELRTQVVH
jgi:Lon protease-like protein